LAKNKLSHEKTATQIKQKHCTAKNDCGKSVRYEKSFMRKDAEYYDRPSTVTNCA